MKQITFLILFGALSLISVAGCGSAKKKSESAKVEIRDVVVPPREEEAPKHRILVLPFLQERLNGSEAVAESARQAVVRELASTGQFVMISLSDFPQDPKKFINEDQEYDLHQISRIASAMGVAAVIEGKILGMRARQVGDSVGLIRQAKAKVAAQVRIRMFAGKNGKEILNQTRSAETDATSTKVAARGEVAPGLSEDPELVRSAIRAAFVGAVPGIVRAVEKLSWEGRVAMVSGERVYINAGRLSGLQVGDILKVTEEGDDVYDPETGRFIGMAPGRLKGTVEVVSYFGKDGAVAVIHSGSGFQENDRVELY
jgi:hypothetical protein